MRAARSMTAARVVQPQMKVVRPSSSARTPTPRSCIISPSRKAEYGSWRDAEATRGFREEGADSAAGAGDSVEKAQVDEVGDRDLARSCILAGYALDHGLHGSGARIGQPTQVRAHRGV